MSLLNRRWHEYPKESILSSQLSKEFNISDEISQVIINRGLKTKDEVGEFLNPKLGSLRDPFEIPGMKKAAERTLLAKERGEKVLVYGDYDVDGVTATSIIVLALRKLGIEASYYIPHRYNEGYGLNKSAIKKFSDDGIKLLITVDCGVTDFEEVSYANSLGIDVIITDHHNIPSKLPPAFAVINPKMFEGKHPSKNLSGAGVAFKFVWALFRSAGIPDTIPIKEFLDLAALGTIADVVPLTEENRVITVSGMKLINEKKRMGVKHLIDAAGINGHIDTHKVSFMLAPRLNAPGRLEHANLSIRLLLENDKDSAIKIAEEINKINRERQSIGSLIGEEAFAKTEDIETKKVIVLSSEGWHPGVIGIVASKIAEKFNRPSILISINGDVCRGSARSIEGFDVYELLSSCKDLFMDFGGHKDAAGFEMPAANIEKLRERLCSQIDGCLTIDNLKAKTRIDAEIPTERIKLSFAQELLLLEPFGQGNPEPVLMSKKLRVISSKKVGAKGNHLKINFSDGSSAFDAIGFGIGSLAGEVSNNLKFDVAYNLAVNEWDGLEFPQLQLVDLRRDKQ